MPDLLLVDNDRRIVELNAWFLERRGYAVRSALSYRDAREAIRERRPDLMLADLELGDENGREELPRLMAEGLLPRTLVVSGFLDAALDTELRCLAQVVDTLAKPYDMNALEARIIACLQMPIPAALVVGPSGAEDRGIATESEAFDKSIEVAGRVMRAVDPERVTDVAASAQMPISAAQGPQTALSTPAADSGPAADPVDSAPVPVEPRADLEDDDDEGWVEIVPFRRGPGGGA